MIDSVNNPVIDKTYIELNPCEDPCILTIYCLSCLVMHFPSFNHLRYWYVFLGILCFYDLYFCFQENDSKRARAVKKANDERDLKKQKNKEIGRLEEENDTFTTQKDKLQVYNLI